MLVQSQCLKPAFAAPGATPPGPSFDDVNHMTHSPVGARATDGSCASGSHVSIAQSLFVYGPSGVSLTEWVTIELLSQAHTLQPCVNSAANLMMCENESVTRALRRCSRVLGTYM